MHFCDDHWSALRAEVEKQGLSSLVPEGGEKAAAAMASQAQEGLTIDNFDPLMGAHNAIVMNALQFVGESGVSPLVMFSSDSPHHCPLCFLNWMAIEHAKACEKKDCEGPKDEETAKTWYDWMIERSVQDQVDDWKSLGAG